MPNGPPRKWIGDRWHVARVNDPCSGNAEEACGFESLNTEDDRIEHREHKLTGAIVRVAAANREMQRECLLESNARKKAVRKIDAAVSRDAVSAIRNNKFSWPSGHIAQS